MITERMWGQPLPGPLDVEPRVDMAEARAMLAAALDGVPVGAYDRRIIAWLAG